MGSDGKRRKPLSFLSSEGQGKGSNKVQRSLWDGNRNDVPSIDVYASESESETVLESEEDASIPGPYSIKDGMERERDTKEGKNRINFIQMRVNQSGTDASLKRYGLLTEEDMRRWSCWRTHEMESETKRPPISFTGECARSSSAWETIGPNVRARRITSTRLVELSSYRHPPLIDQRFGSRIAVTYKDLQEHKRGSGGVP